MDLHILAMRRVTGVALLLFAILTVVYGFLDYSRIPAIKGDVSVILFSFVYGGVQLYFFRAYRYDARQEIALETKLASLLEQAGREEGKPKRVSPRVAASASGSPIETE